VESQQADSRIIRATGGWIPSSYHRAKLRTCRRNKGRVTHRPPLFILTVIQTAGDPTTLSRTTSTASAPPIIPASVLTLEGMKPQEKKRKKYAKTLRLTSDQLKQLDLKPGANAVTFSLSASGVAACTARIFVWDHTDSIVVSDIDGTITKYRLALFQCCNDSSRLPLHHKGLTPLGTCLQWSAEIGRTLAWRNCTPIYAVTATRSCTSRREPLARPIGQDTISKELNRTTTSCPRVPSS